ncbi:MAG: N-sulfoglucosamine sulfohydrolase [Saprospiraceae bacterium]|jgi:N-sulfoglucosamine sulfohydrolase
MNKMIGRIVRIALISLAMVCIVLGSACNYKQDLETKLTDAKKLELPEKPNILWLVTEDMGPWIPPFGDSTIQTPNLSRLAAQGVRFPNFFSTSGVCAPSRAAISTGMYPSSIGANHMRTASSMDVTGLPAYEAVPPADVKMMSEILRMNGYYCTNNVKQDYQYKAPVTAWDESSPYAHWRNRNDGQPFFSIFNFTVTHESGLFEPYGFLKGEIRHYKAGDRNFNVGKGRGRLSEGDTPVHVAKNSDFSIPPYLPDTEKVRRDMWKMYNNIAEMDRQLGAILNQLEEDGLLEKTIIFFYGDHGGPLPRQKRLIYDSGLNTPLMVRYPKQQKAGSIDMQLASFIDLAPTALSIAGIQPPSYIQGQALVGEYGAPQKREYIHAAADRFDGMTDAIRAVHDGRYKYIRNYRPEQPYYLPVGYRERIPAMQELLRLRDSGELNEDQMQWFREEKPRDELFDVESDPHELTNLANDPNYKAQLDALSKEMDRWLADINDVPNKPERELIAELWNGDDEKPVTQDPVIENNGGQISITVATAGASIGYKRLSSKGKEDDSWSIYQSPISLSGGERIKVQAHRIGYKPSDEIVWAR